MSTSLVLSTWVLTTALYSTLAHGLLLALLERAVVRPAHRVVVWRAALILPAVVAAVVVGRDVRRNPRPGQLSVTAAVASLVPASWGRRTVDENVQATVNRPPVRTVSLTDPLAQSVSFVVLVASGVGALTGYLRLRRRRASELAAIGSRVPLGPPLMLGGITMRVSCADVPSPLALRGGEVCVPRRGFFTLAPAEQESVLLHEASHVERADASWLELAHLVRGLLWWQPLSAGLMRALISDTELAADERAVSLGASPTRLVAALMHLSEKRPAATSVGVTFVAGSSALVERSRHILGFGRPAPPQIVRALVAGALLVSGVALLRVGAILATARGTPSGCVASALRACGFVRAPDVRTTDLR